MNVLNYLKFWNSVRNRVIAQLYDKTGNHRTSLDRKQIHRLNQVFGFASGRVITAAQNCRHAGIPENKF